MSQDIVDEIDALVDEQLAGGESRQGYDYGDPTYPKCPHCDRHWHGLAITERIAKMYRFGYYDEKYVAAEDDSRVLCQGSDFIGPMPSESGTEKRSISMTVDVGEGYTTRGGSMQLFIRPTPDISACFVPYLNQVITDELIAEGWLPCGVIRQGEPGEPGIHNSPDDWQSIVGGRQPAVVTDYIENTTIRGTAE